ncbi:MAG TPA: hypothetical protein VKI44_14180 [Acetobacteraceae bacterium]|nr:hypothetical protein [Acetobacteraceae bacterium]
MSVPTLSAVFDFAGMAAEVVEIGRHHNAKRLHWKISEDPLNYHLFRNRTFGTARRR